MSGEIYGVAQTSEKQRSLSHGGCHTLHSGSHMDDSQPLCPQTYLHNFFPGGGGGGEMPWAL